MTNTNLHLWFRKAPTVSFYARFSELTQQISKMNFSLAHVLFLHQVWEKFITVHNPADTQTNKQTTNTSENLTSGKESHFFIESVLHFVCGVLREKYNDRSARPHKPAVVKETTSLTHTHTHCPSLLLLWLSCSFHLKVPARLMAIVECVYYWITSRKNIHNVQN